MAVLTLLSSLVFVIWVCIQFLTPRKLPPGPHPLPIVGNIFQVSKNFHRSLANLSQIYGPLMSIKLGNKTMIVVSSPDIAKELLQKYDHTFTRRVVTDAAQALDHHKRSVGWLPCSNQWRNIRKLCKEHVFSSERLNATQGLREKKVQQLCDYVNQCCIQGKMVDIGGAAFTTLINLISSSLCSVDLAEYDSKSSQELKGMVSGLLTTLGAPNIADFLPALRVIDPQGIRRRSTIYFRKLLEAFDLIIKQRLQERLASRTYLRRDDFLETLLDLTEQNEAEWSYKDTRHLLLDLLIAGSESTSIMVQWTMSELLRNPGKRAKARAEIREVMGKSKYIQESDISRLPYLQALVKETFRLHPATTVLPRLSDSDIAINQYILPKDSQILVNIWAVGRDPRTWSDPDSFVPERFLDKEMDVKGHHFELLPFGTGRRVCLGMSLARRMLHLIVASLLRQFDWKLEEGVKPEDIDMNETFGAVVEKAITLKAIPISVNK